MKRQKRIAAAGIVAIVLVYLTAFVPKKHIAIEDAPLGMRLKRADTIERARSLAGYLWPNSQNVQIVAEYTQVKLGVASPYSPSEPVSSAWLVGCDDARGNALGTFIWNAQTGDLISIVAGSSSSIDPNSGYPRMKPKEIHKVTKQWMNEIAPQQPGAPWREVSETIAENVVSSEWATKDRIAQLHINPTSGELITFRSTVHPTRGVSKAAGLD
jgi:hypothetical protein